MTAGDVQSASLLRSRLCQTSQSCPECWCHLQDVRGDQAGDEVVEREVLMPAGEVQAGSCKADCACQKVARGQLRRPHRIARLAKESAFVLEESHKQMLKTLMTSNSFHESQLCQARNCINSVNLSRRIRVGIDTLQRHWTCIQNEIQEVHESI